MKRVKVRGNVGWRKMMISRAVDILEKEKKKVAREANALLQILSSTLISADRVESKNKQANKTSPGLWTHFFLDFMDF